jgi:hypothetical protein
MKGILRSFLLPSLLGLLSFALGQAQTVPSAKERFLSEAPHKWAEYRTLGKRLQGSCLVSYRDRSAGAKVFSSVRYECKQNDVCALALTQDLGDTPKTRKGRLEVVNSRYAFRLERSAPDRPWILVGTSFHPEQGYGLSRLTPDVRVAGIFVDKALSFSSIHECLVDMIRDPDFVIKNVTAVVQEGQEGVRLEFSNRPKMTAPRKVKANEIPGGWNPVGGGWVLLDPAHYWVIRAYDVHTEWQDRSTGRMTATFSYKEGQNGLPILSRILGNYKGTTAQGSRAETEDNHEYNLTERPDVPESEFMLTAFGLPEPPEVPGRPRWYLWAAAMGVLCLILAVLFRTLGRRTAART